MRIETERLFLREMTADDYDALYAVLADPDISRHYPYAFDEARVRDWIERNLDRVGTFGFGLWAVCLKDSGEMIGDCGLTMQAIDGVIRPEIGYHIRKDRQRMGFASEAARAVRDWAFRHTPFNAVYSYMRQANVPSARTALAYGCRKVGAYEDGVNGIVEVYRITREEWNALRGQNGVTEGMGGVTIREERLSAGEYVGFLKRTDLGSQYPKERFAERIERLVDRASISLAARDENGLLVGALLALTDFSYWLFVTDLGVDRAYERRGIGGGLMKRAHALAGGEKDVAVYLVANDGALPFYRKLGMEKAEDVMQYCHIDWTEWTVGEDGGDTIR